MLKTLTLLLSCSLLSCSRPVRNSVDVNDSFVRAAFEGSLFLLPPNPDGRVNRDEVGHAIALIDRELLASGFDECSIRTCPPNSGCLDMPPNRGGLQDLTATRAYRVREARVVELASQEAPEAIRAAVACAGRDVVILELERGRNEAASGGFVEMRRRNGEWLAVRHWGEWST